MFSHPQEIDIVFVGSGNGVQAASISAKVSAISAVDRVAVSAGVPKPGGIYPPNNLAVSPNSLSVVYICIPPNNLTLVCVGVHLNSGKKVFHC